MLDAKDGTADYDLETEVSKRAKTKKKAKKSVKKTTKKSAPKSASTKSKKTSKPPAGTGGNPRKVSDPHNFVFEGKDGFYEVWTVEEQNKEGGPWFPTWEFCSSKTQAKKVAKEYRDNEEASSINRQRHQWIRNNPAAVQRVQQVEFKVTEKTTQKDIEAHANRLAEIKETLKNGKKIEEPTFLPDAYPKYRPVRRVIEVHTETEF
jgi:hypothetical protein